MTVERRKVLITGSSRTGTATARLARAQGADVFLHGLSESAGLLALAQEIPASCVVADTGDPVRVAVEKVVEEWGEVNSLVNSAGVLALQPFGKMSTAD